LSREEPPTIDGHEAFVREHTRLEAVPFAGGIQMHLATEVTALWQATEAWLVARQVPPPFWAFAWAGGQALARYVLEHPEVVRGKRVLDAATGGGIVAIAAAMAGASHVTAVDLDPFAVAATRLNARANGVMLVADCRDVLADTPAIDVVLAGDVFYEQPMASLFARWFDARRSEGITVFAGDPARTYGPQAGEDGENRGVRVVASYVVPVPLDLEGRETKQTRVLAFA
jgi:predicted nicotinamide N-methyase